MRYYLDTNIWIDILEDRKGFSGEPLGEYGSTFLFAVLGSGGSIVVSDILRKELERRCSHEEIVGLFAPFQHCIERIASKREQRDEAKELAMRLDVPQADALHAILSRDHSLVLVSRDRHFTLLIEVCIAYRPEDLSNS